MLTVAERHGPDGSGGEERPMGLLRRKHEAEPETTIDLREPAPSAAPQWGSPVPCPSCGGRGYLDHIDPFREVMYLHCIECFDKFEVARADLDHHTVV